MQIDRQYVAALLERLVNTYSVSGSEKAIGDLIYNELDRLGVEDLEKQYAAEDRFNVLGRIKGARPGPRILFTGHMDTVPAGEGWKTAPFQATVRGGQLAGRGALDMKGGIAAVLGAAKYLASNREKLCGEMLIAFVPDEEVNSIGVNKLIESGIGADFAIAAEPEYDMVIGNAGKMLIRVEVTGVAAHGAYPEEGVNAVEDAGRFLAKLEEIPIPRREHLKSQPYVTLKIEGGFKEYSVVVPDSCTMLINKHTVPEETKDFVLEQMNALVKKEGLKSEFKFEILEPYYPSFVIDRNLNWVTKLEGVFQEITGEPLRLAYGTGVCDNNRLVPVAGIPAVCMGPRGGGLHQKDEWVDLESVYLMSEIYCKYMMD